MKVYLSASRRSSIIYDAKDAHKVFLPNLGKTPEMKGTMGTSHGTRGHQGNWRQGKNKQTPFSARAKARRCLPYPRERKGATVSQMRARSATRSGACKRGTVSSHLEPACSTTNCIHMCLGLKKVITTRVHQGQWIRGFTEYTAPCLLPLLR